MTDQMKENNIKVAVAIIHHNTCLAITRELGLNCNHCFNSLCCVLPREVSVSMEIYFAKRLINTRKWLMENCTNEELLEILL